MVEAIVDIVVNLLNILNLILGAYVDLNEVEKLNWMGETLVENVAQSIANLTDAVAQIMLNTPIR